MHFTLPVVMALAATASALKPKIPPARPESGSGAHYPVNPAFVVTWEQPLEQTDGKPICLWLVDNTHNCKAGFPLASGVDPRNMSWPVHVSDLTKTPGPMQCLDTAEACALGTCTKYYPPGGGPVRHDVQYEIRYSVAPNCGDPKVFPDQFIQETVDFFVDW
ncbi:hypothetical protein N7456_007843 [Penicillium angulare]|uniref:Uncharacterized protein n=1 Tax=Penicillium angulare TaxID=116970 RepID=A0A9W9FBF7_9EURO|nr:hypothetical protein N7456_007843 [Penicillium angulare]